ncbi:MAG: hypothetical protein ACTS5V_12280, partial [Giesbergeria sp.]
MPTGKASQQNIQQPAVWLRIALVVALALALATAIAAGSTDSPYEDQLVDLALRQSHGPRWNGIALNSSAVKAVLLDYDNELAFKAQLAIEKYGDDAQDVLVRFGDDPSFQEVVRQYGENTIPVISYFVKNDIASVRLFYLAQQKSDATIAAAKGLWARLWHQAEEADSTAEKLPDTYGPDLRGQRAITTILQDGHQFLGQFVVDAQGQAAWVQTERTVDAVKSLFLSGAINLERKYKSGTPLEPVDVLSAGVDVFIFVGAFKALKFLRATQKVRAVGVMQRTQLLGAPLLRRSALGRYAMKYGLAAGAVTLMVQHPSLLNGVFVALGKSLGLSPFLAKTIGWSLLLAPLLLPLLSLLTLALSVAGTLLLATGKGLRWTRTRLGWRRARTV